MPDNEDIQLWEESASAWISHLDTRGDQSRRFLDPRVHEVFGDVDGKKILDIGCGEGRFSRQLSERGGEVTGLEPTPKLLARAKELGGATFLNARAESLPFPDESFDIAIFYLVLIDIDPFEPAIEEAYRVLKPGEKCVIVNSTGMNTATNRLWEWNDTGERTAWLVEHYGTRQRVVAEWNGIRVNNYHRPLSTYFMHCLNVGFALRFFEEQIPTPEELEQNPGLAVHLICPYFNIQVWGK